MTTYHVLEVANELSIDSVCLASSINVLGSNFQAEPTEVTYLPMDESHPLTPRDPYALGKHCLEVTADGFARLDEPPRTISSIRFPWVLSESELRRMLAEVDRSMDGIRNPPAFMADVNEYTTRDVMFSYLHVADAADIVRRAIEADFDGHEAFWAVASDTTAAVDSERLVEACYEDVERRRPIGGRNALIETEKAHQMLGWEPQHSWTDFT